MEITEKKNIYFPSFLYFLSNVISQNNLNTFTFFYFLLHLFLSSYHIFVPEKRKIRENKTFFVLYL